MTKRVSKRAELELDLRNSVRNTTLTEVVALIEREYGKHMAACGNPHVHRVLAEERVLVCAQLLAEVRNLL